MDHRTPPRLVACCSGRRVRAVIAVVASAVVAASAGCSGGDTEIASPFTESPTTITVAATMSPSDNTPVPTTADAPTTTSGGSTVTAPLGAVTLSPDGPWRLVESAPGVETPGLVYELMPGLFAYLPVKEDLEAGIGWFLTETDRPVIEAYLQARLVYFRAVNQNPMYLDSPDWERWYVDGGSAYRAMLEPRAAVGEHGDLDLGVVIRPSVVGDERSATTALVVSCTLDGGVILTANGDLAEGSTWGVAESQSAFRMSLLDGAWKVIEYGGAVGVCGG